MRKPNLNRMWETFIKTSIEDVSSGRHIDTIRLKIYPMISDLMKKEVINWYCFLIHRNPKDKNDPNPYFHVRVSLEEDANPEVLFELLPDYCLFTQHIRPSRVAKINVGRNKHLDTSVLKTEKIEEAWRIIGEQSEWLLNMLGAYKSKVDIPFRHIAQFFHYYFNMINLQSCCPNCRQVFRPDFFFIPWSVLPPS